MQTKKIVQHEFKVSDLREFAESKGYVLPPEFSVSFPAIKEAGNGPDGDDQTTLIWVEYREER